MIYDQDAIAIDQSLESRVGKFTRSQIRVNCRNTPRIAQALTIYTGLKPYKRVRRPDNNVDCQLLYYNNETEQQKMLVRCLEEYRDNRINYEDIIILSPKGDKSAASNMKTSPWNQRLVPFHNASKGHIAYETIHSFKGMERPAIIITDINETSKDEAESLLYVGMTRATDRVTILVSEKAKAQLLNRLVKASE